MRFGSYVDRGSPPSVGQLTALAVRMKAKLGDAAFMTGRTDVEAAELFTALNQDAPLPDFAKTPEAFAHWGAEALTKNP